MCDKNMYRSVEPPKKCVPPKEVDPPRSAMDLLREAEERQRKRKEDRDNKI